MQQHYLIYYLTYDGPQYLFTAVGNPIRALESRGYLDATKDNQLDAANKPLFESAATPFRVTSNGEQTLLFALPIE